MRSPDRHRTIALCLAIGAVAAGCANKADTATRHQTATTEAPGVAINTEPGQDETPPTQASSIPGAPPVAPATEAQATSTATLPVDGGEIPAALVDGYAHNGGDLTDPAEWKGRFGQAPLPELSGPGVRLVEGLRRMELLDGQWERTDEAGWLAMSSDDRDSMMNSLRNAAGIVGVASTTTSTEQGADA